MYTEPDTENKENCGINNIYFTCTAYSIVEEINGGVVNSCTFIITVRHTV